MEFNSIRDITINVTGCVIDISRGDDEICRFISAKEKYFSVQSSNGSLSITQNAKTIIYAIIKRRIEAKLILPKSFFGKLRLRNKNGGLYIKDGLFQDIDLYTKNGKFDIRGITCNQFSLKMKNGFATLEKVNANGDINIKCANGDIKSQSLACPSLIISCHNARVGIFDVKSDKIDCSTHNGTIEASGVDCPDVRLETSNGKIGALCSGDRADYRLILETESGAIAVNGSPTKNVSDRLGAKRRVFARTRNGDIDVKFI